MTTPLKKLEMAQAGSVMQKEFDRDQGLAEKYLAEANAKDLYELYQQRCHQLDSFGTTLGTMSELYAGKGDRKFMQPTADAISSMEKVALAAIQLAQSIASKK